jgi:hypothetical protein
MEKRCLITLNDLKYLRPTAELDGVRYEPYCLEAQDQDLRPILGDGLFYDLMSEFQDTGDNMYAAYQELINGKAYSYNGQTIYFDGIKPMLGYFTLARLVQNHSTNITRFGVVSKVVQQSTPVDPQVLRQVVNELKSNAQTYINQVTQFLLENQTTYTLYIGSDTNRSTGFRILKG